MDKSNEIGNLAKALVEFHRKVPSVTKEATNPFFKSKYASLSNIIDTIKPTLTECGLTLMQFPFGEDGLHSILIHAESGEYIGAYYEMPVAKKDDPQALGSSITYARRYSLQAILMINVEEDDDGNKASGKVGPTQSKAPAPKPSLHQKHEKWNDAVVFYAKQGQPAMTTIKQSFLLSKVDEANLIADALKYNADQDGTDGSTNS
jgi:hypothetical protein